MAPDTDEAGRPVQWFVDALGNEERMLVILKHELYEGRWDEMVADLQARLAGRPYIFKLAHRIEDDLERIRRLRAFETDHNVDLSEYVKMES
ncbi:MAG: hypothetical protein JXA11_15120 [Phycisphaerae bacterium]|nr:hypothetical protein [Phycisphaerae bacterium]